MEFDGLAETVFGFTIVVCLQTQLSCSVVFQMISREALQYFDTRCYIVGQRRRL
eukprot:m.168831 g.168831  ORF g.168831 m.168831 type:complete len:54 (-) comp16468_c1_seq1:825-986(-)